MQINKFSKSMSCHRRANNSLRRIPVVAANKTIKLKGGSNLEIKLRSSSVESISGSF